MEHCSRSNNFFCHRASAGHLYCYHHRREWLHCQFDGTPFDGGTGENIQVVGTKRMEAAGDETISSYVHPPANKIGVLVKAEGQTHEFSATASVDIATGMVVRSESKEGTDLSAGAAVMAELAAA